MSHTRAPSHSGLTCTLILCLAGLVLAITAEWPRALLDPQTHQTNAPSDGFFASVESVGRLLSENAITLSGLESNQVNPFFTTVFEPPPTPAKPAPKPPPPPEPRRIRLVYRGLYENARKEREAFISVDDQLMTGSVGTVLLSHLKQGITISSMSTEAVTLTRSKGEPITLPFRKPFVLVVPH